MLKRLLYILLYLCCSAQISAQLIYVKAGSTGTGSSWLDASGDLNEVLTNVNSGTQIWVAAGTYYPVLCSNCSDLQRNISFEIPDSVSLYGGFSGSELTLEDRDWENNITILSGDIDQDGQANDNSKTIIYFNRVSDLTILDGFHIVDGYAFSPGGATAERENSGAAIFNQGSLDGSNSHPVLRNCKFFDHYALGFGGAVFNSAGFGGNASPLFENCIFENNTSELGGGAIFNQSNYSGISMPILLNCNFKNNVANTYSGGAVYNQGAENGNGSPVFLNCHFEANFTSDYGGAVHNNGRKGKSNSTFENCTFLNNEATFGGGVSNDGTLNGEANSTFTDCTFTENHVTVDGAGMYNLGSESGVSNVTLKNCLFKDNGSNFAGAAIFNNGIDGESNAIITNCRFIGNNAMTYGGAIYNNGKNGNASALITNCLFQDNLGNSGGAVYNLGSENGLSSPKITNCTFYGNAANVGGAIYNNASDSTGTSSPIITNCIFWKNEANFGNIFRNIFGTPFIQYSVVEEADCNALNSGMGSVVTCGESILYNLYPEFKDTLNDDFRLIAGSPMIDIGDNFTIDTLNIDFDLDNQDRIFNGVVDFGAYEYYDVIIPPFITQQPLSQNLCEEETILLNIAVGGTLPFGFQWYKNGAILANETADSLIIEISNTGDSGDYFCLVMNTFGDTLQSEMAAILVKPLLTPGIELDASELNICDNQEVTFNVFLINEGDDDVVTWYLNGNQIAQNVTIITLNTLNDEDQIAVELSSSLACPQPAIVFDTVQINVSPVLSPTIEISGSDSIFCLGYEAIFQAFYTNGGLSPSFQWQLNGSDIFGENSEVFSSTELINNDVLSCSLTSSELCTETNPVLSAPIIVSIDSCVTNAISYLDNQLVQISPNPSNGLFNIKTNELIGVYDLQIFDVSGKIIYTEKFKFDLQNSHSISIPDAGLYFIKISGKETVYFHKLIVTIQH